LDLFETGKTCSAVHLVKLVPRRLFCIALLLSAGLAPFCPAPARPADWAKAIDRLTADDAAHPPAKEGIVFVGSSSIARWETLAADFPDLPVIRRGFGGSELADSVFYADRIVIPCHPRLVVLYAGENDIAAGKTAETVAADFDAFCAKVLPALPDVRIIFVSLKPSPLREKFMPEFARANALIAAACARNPRLAFVDIYHAMLDSQGRLRPELYVGDRLHMDHDGYAIWIRLLNPLLTP
jgi:GDSL-like Lipase/Acylhydrolase family